MKAKLPKFRILQQQCNRGSIPKTHGALLPMCQALNDVMLRTLRAHHVKIKLTWYRDESLRCRLVGEIRFSSFPCRDARKIRSGTPYSRWLIASLPYFAILPTTQRTRELHSVGNELRVSPRNFVG